MQTEGGKWQKAYLGLGGNIGDVRQTMTGALNELDSRNDIEVMAVASLYRTPPWGDENQDWFLNTCAEIITTLEPLALLDCIKKMEIEFKRKKTRKWGPRTLDIDILLYEDVELDSERLKLPHPRMANRAFVLVPLKDIAPGIMIEGKSLDELINGIDCSQIEEAEKGGKWKNQNWLT